MTIFAVISGAESWEDIEDFGETHLDFLKQYGDFENGIPVHDTIARVVSCISPAKFHECFINWMRDCHSSDDKDVIAIDGKTLRHSYDKSRRRGAIHGFAPIFPDICYHLTHYKPAAADIPVASDNPAHYADAIRYNARTPLQGSLLPLTRLVWA